MAPTELVGTWRHPQQLLQRQQLASGPTVHDAAVASSLALAGPPIEGPTHFSSFVPLALATWGDSWFAEGGISVHFKSPVVEGEATRAALRHETGERVAAISMEAADARAVLEGVVWVGDAPVTPCAQRMAAARRPDDLRILDRVDPSMAPHAERASLTADRPIGPLYPFSLADKLAVITEPHPWYSDADNPWRAPLVPLEMIAPLLHQHNGMDAIPTSREAVGLFLDQEISVHGGPLLVGEKYDVIRDIAAVGGGRSTESLWLRTTATDSGGLLRARMLLHIGFLRATAAD